jgi:hypothetical protein
VFEDGISSGFATLTERRKDIVRQYKTALERRLASEYAPEDEEYTAEQDREPAGGVPIREPV